MSREEVAVVALLVILVAVLWRKNVKAAASFLGLMSFTLEAKDPKRTKPSGARRTRMLDKVPPPLTK
jgi:hypothetical protein